MSIIEVKLCKKCGFVKPLTEEYFYKARPRKNHAKESWQSFCKVCWKEINRANKERRKFSLNVKRQLVVICTIGVTSKLLLLVFSVTGTFVDSI